MAATTRFADHILSGLLSARPSASSVPTGTIYAASDTGIIYQTAAGAWGTYLAKPSVATDAIIDAKGDLIVGTAADTASRLAVGSDNQVLTADSAQTTGVKWATPSSGFTSPLTTKGDIHTYTSVDARLAVGSDGQVLTADSAQTAGIKWAAAAGGSGALTMLSDTVLGSANTFDVSSISGSYKDLIIVAYGFSNQSITTNNWCLRFNNDSASNYAWIWGTFNGTSTSVFSSGASGQIKPGSLPGSNQAGAPPGFIEITIPGYAGSTEKIALFDNVYVTGTNTTNALTAGSQSSNRGMGFWTGTAAITRVQLFTDGSPTSLTTGARMTIYGRA